MALSSLAPVWLGGLLLMACVSRAVPNQNAMPGDLGGTADCSEDNTAALQSAIDRQFNQGKISLKPGRCYKIGSTLVFKDAREGIFEGNGARLVWAGDSSSPALLLSDVRDATISNLRIECGRAHPLHTAIRIENGPGKLIPPTSNVLDSIIVEAEMGTVRNGVHIALGPGGDFNNENHSLTKVKIRNYTESAFRIDHSQAKNIQFRDCECTADPSSAQTRCLTSGVSNGGSFHWYGGSGGGNALSDFHIGNPTDTISIQAFHSERSKRFLTTGGPSNAPMVLRISGVRFAADQLAADRVAIDYKYPGPLTIENSIFGEQAQRAPKIRLTSFVPAFASIQGSLFAAYNSVQEDPLEFAGGGRWEIVWANNVFVGSTGSVLGQEVQTRQGSRGSLPGRDREGANAPQRAGIPGTSQSPCQTGQWAADNRFFYVCATPNTWKRAPLGGW